MNKKRMLQLAEHLEKPETAEHFDMRTYLRPGDRDFSGTFGKQMTKCGTVGCIAGHAIALFRPRSSTSSVYRVAKELLNLNHDEADHLFGYLGSPEDVRDNVAAAQRVRAMVAAEDAGSSS